MLEELIIRTLCDTLPDNPVDGAYLFAQTKDNEGSVFETAQYLLGKGITQKILFIDTPARSGYPGFNSWHEALVKRGVDKSMLEAVPPIPANTDILHTRIEGESLVHHVKQQSYKSILITASPFQQTRAFMAAVTATLSGYPELKVYSYPGKALPWLQKVAHSQGEVQNTRTGLIAGEIARVKKYHEKGDLLGVDQVLEYLNKRDRSL